MLFSILNQHGTVVARFHFKSQHAANNYCKYYAAKYLGYGIYRAIAN